MAWKEVKVENQRIEFIQEYLENKFTMAEICRHFEISRTIGYKWLERYNEEGFEGLKDRSKAPLNQSQATPKHMIEEILKLKSKWSKWGPKKIRGELVLKQPSIAWPSINTIGNILDKNGLVIRRKYRKRFPEKTSPLSHANQCNDVWSIDFKGWWLTCDKQKCDPLTLTDNYSRFLLRCLKLDYNDVNHVWGILQVAFHEYGLPNYLLSDNGPPFATSGVGRLSSLSINIIKAGVIPQWIEPGNPQQNGRHERMHGTLKQEAVFPELNLLDQKKELEIFQDYYNYKRPHEALGQVPPANFYSPSIRTWNGKLKPPEYPDDYKRVKIKSCGKMSWKGHEIYVGRVLSEELVGINETENGFKVHYGPITLGTITNEYTLDVPRRKGRIRKNIPIKKD